MTTRRSVWMALMAAATLSGAAATLAASAVSASDGPSGATGLVEVVLRATERFRDPAEAEAAEYLSANSCVSGPEEGAMGVHYIKGALVGDGRLDPEQPEALIYEVRRGRAKLVGVEYIVLAEGWHAHTAAPPVLMGQQMHLVNSPNRYGLPAFYELHVWAWRSNPKGTFVDWNPTVSCAGFEPEPSQPMLSAHDHGVRP